MNAEVASGSGDLLEELRAEIDFASGCAAAKIAYEPSNDILELLTASRDEIEKLTTIVGLLRAQLRVLGHIPCVIENEEVAKAELKMRTAARGN